MQQLKSSTFSGSVAIFQQASQSLLFESTTTLVTHPLLRPVKIPSWATCIPDTLRSSDENAKLEISMHKLRQVSFTGHRSQLQVTVIILNALNKLNRVS